MSINTVTLEGHVGQTPEITTLANGTKVAKFSLATSEKYTTKDNQQVDNTEWHNIVAWRWLADVVEKNVSKGDGVAVIGKITYRSWEKDGQKRTSTEIIANHVSIIPKKTEAPSKADFYPTREQRQQAEAQQNTQPVVAGYAAQEQDDLPF